MTIPHDKPCAWCGKQERRIRIGKRGERFELKPIESDPMVALPGGKPEPLHDYCRDAFNRWSRELEHDGMYRLDYVRLWRDVHPRLGKCLVIRYRRYSTSYAAMGWFSNPGETTMIVNPQLYEM